MKNISWRTGSGTDDLIDLFIHYDEGTQGYVAYFQNTQGGLDKVYLSESDLAEKINHFFPDLKKPVRLLSCNSIESAKELSSYLPDRVIYATDDIVVVYEDGGITTIARSGNSTQKWRKLKNGEDIGEAPVPGKGSKQGHAVMMGENVLISYNHNGIGYLKEYENIQLVELSFPGSEKEAYKISLAAGSGYKDKIVVKMKDDIGYPYQRMVTRIDQQVQMLSLLGQKDIPVVEVFGVTQHKGIPAMVQKRYRFSYGPSDGEIIPNDFEKKLTQASITDLNKIKNGLIKNQMGVTDLQFLIDNKGRVVVFDPTKIEIGTEAKKLTKANIRYIDNLLSHCPK